MGAGECSEEYFKRMLLFLREKGKMAGMDDCRDEDMLEMYGYFCKAMGERQGDKGHA